VGLYLCVFEGDEELEGVEVGSYADFEWFRQVIADQLEGGRRGSRFPLLQLHADSDGEWSLSEIPLLRQELDEIARDAARLPPLELSSSWQRDAMRQAGRVPADLSGCFVDVDGEPLLERLQTLCDVAWESHQPILFQ